MGYRGADVKLVAYLRVSTRAQADEGFGLEVQAEAIEKWIAKHGHELVAVMRNEGVSGTREAVDHEGLSEALSAIESGAAEGLVVARLDRLARSLTVQEAVLATVWKTGGRAFSVDVDEIQRDDPDDPMRTFIRQVMGAAAQLERSMIASRMRAGRQAKHAAGGYAFGAPPYGSRTEKKALVPVPHEQAIITRMVDLRAQGHALRAIAAQLDQEGLRPRRAARWDASAIGRILNRLEKETTTLAA